MEVYINNNGLGNVIVGSVLDVNKRHLERDLKRYEKDLYLKWNPMKTMKPDGKVEILPLPGPYWRGFGTGVWELRCRPLTKSAVPKWEYNDQVIFNIEYVEIEGINCIKDFSHLSYDILRWVKEHDLREYKDFCKELEYQEDKSYDKALDANKADLKYRTKYYRKAMADFKEALRSGRSPLEYLSGRW